MLPHFMISDATTKKINDQITLVKLNMVQSKYDHSSDGSTSLLINGVIVYHNANTKLMIAFMPEYTNHHIVCLRTGAKT